MPDSLIVVKCYLRNYTASLIRVVIVVGRVERREERANDYERDEYDVRQCPAEVIECVGQFRDENRCQTEKYRQSCRDDAECHVHYLASVLDVFDA